MSQLFVKTFGPKALSTNTSNVAVTASNQSTSLGTLAGQKQYNVRLVNNGTQVVFFNFTTGAGTAATGTDMPILPGTVEVFEIPATATYINCIAGATGSTLYWTLGEGV